MYLQTSNHENKLVRQAVRSLKYRVTVYTRVYKSRTNKVFDLAVFHIRTLTKV